MNDMTSISINCWPGLKHPFTVEESFDYDMREKHCKEVLSRMSKEELIATQTAEGWLAFLDEHWKYEPDGYIKPTEVTQEQRQEWSKKLSRKYYVVQRSAIHEEKEID